MKLLFRVPAELRALAKALHIHAGAGRWTELTASRIHGLIDGIVERLAKLESEEKGDDMNRFVDKIDADAAAPELRGDIEPHRRRDRWGRSPRERGCGGGSL